MRYFGFFKKILFLHCIAIFLGLGPKNAGKKSILILGDSLTAGYGVEANQAYPALLEKEIQKMGKSYKVINGGSSGSTSAGAYSRLRWHLKAKPQILILALGANDGLRGLDLKATKSNLQKTIDLAKKNGLLIFLAGMKLPMNYGEKYREDFETLFRDLVKKNKVREIPFLLEGVGGHKSLNLADGIHPNEKGHVIISKTVLKAIKGVL